MAWAQPPPGLLKITVIAVTTDDKGTPGVLEDDTTTLVWEIRNPANLVIRSGSLIWQTRVLESLSILEMRHHLRGLLDEHRRKSVNPPIGNVNQFLNLQEVR